jgi:hypothetical protein
MQRRYFVKNSTNYQLKNRYFYFEIKPKYHYLTKLFYRYDGQGL